MPRGLRLEKTLLVETRIRFVIALGRPHKVIVWNMVTLDCYFEGPKLWEIDWHEYPFAPPAASAWGGAAQLQSGLQPRRANRLLQPTRDAPRSGVFRHNGERLSPSGWLCAPQQ